MSFFSKGKYLLKVHTALRVTKGFMDLRVTKGFVNFRFNSFFTPTDKGFAVN